MFAFSTAAWHKSKMRRHSPWHCIVAWLFKIFPFSFFSKKFMTQLLKLLWLKFTNFISVYWTLFISCFTTFSAECWNYMHQRGTDTKFLCFEHAWGKYGTPSPFGMDVKTRQKCCFSYPASKVRHGTHPRAVSASACSASRDWPIAPTERTAPMTAASKN